MIPSSPRRTWLFLAATLALYYAPDLLTPAAWQGDRLFPPLSAAYQGLLVLLGFGYGVAICRAMIVSQVSGGPLLAAIDQARSALVRGASWQPPVVCVDHPLPFALTAGLLPARCEIFISSGLVARLSPTGLRFLLARAAVHAGARQRLAALLPVMILAVLVPDPKNLADWLVLAAYLVVWLAFHWVFELDADRQAARLMGGQATAGLCEVHAATASPLAWLTPHPPMRWRLRAVAPGGAA